MKKSLLACLLGKIGVYFYMKYLIHSKAAFLLLFFSVTSVVFGISFLFTIYYARTKEMLSNYQKPVSKGDWINLIALTVTSWIFFIWAVFNIYCLIVHGYVWGRGETPFYYSQDPIYVGFLTLINIIIVFIVPIGVLGWYIRTFIKAHKT